MGTPYNVCNGTVSGTVSGETFTIPVGSGIGSPTGTRAGDLVYVVAGAAGSAADITAVSDSQGNEYVAVLERQTNSAPAVIYASLTTAALVAGNDSISVTYAVAGKGEMVVARACSGITAATPDQTISGGSTTGTAASSGATGTLASAAELAIGVIANGAAGGVPTALSFGSGLTVSQGSYLTVFDTSVGDTTAVTASGTLAASAQWSALAATFEFANAVTSTLPTAMLTVAAQPVGISQTATLPVANVELAAQPVTATVSSALVQVPLGTPNVVLQAVPVGVNAQAPVETAALPLPTNLLSADNSDFEGTPVQWLADVSASGVARSEKQALSGQYSLGWVSAGGVTQVHSPKCAVTAGLPYIASLWMYGIAGNDCYVGIEWYGASNALLSTTWGPDSPGMGAWAPLTVSGVAPAGATGCRVAAQVGESNAGDVNYIDLVFLTQTNAQVLVDWSNDTYTPGGNAGQAFMDVSPWVRMDVGIQTTRGRQDSVSEIQPGTASFTLQNDTGLFTRFNQSSIIAASGGSVSLQRRCQINLADEQGNWYTRADGPISEIDYTFDDTGGTNQAAVSITDVLAYLNRQQGQLCWTREQVLLDQPAYSWALDDAGNAGGSGVAAESSGNNGPPMRLFESAGAATATIAWQDTTGGIETLADASAPGMPDGSEYWPAGSAEPTSQVRGLDSGAVGPFTTPMGTVLLTPELTAGTAPNQWTGTAGYQLQAQIPELSPNAAGSDFAVEIWFTQSATVWDDRAEPYGPYIALSLGSSRQQTCVVAGIWLPAEFQVQNYSQPPGFTGKNWPGTSGPSPIFGVSQDWVLDTVPRPHHLVLNVQGGSGAPQMTAYLDGAPVGEGTFALQPGQVFDTICAGGAFGGTGNWYGSLALCQVYNYQLSQSQILAHCQMGQYGMWESTTDDCVAQVANYANIPSFWSNLQANHQGLSLTDYMDLTGSSPLTNMQYYEDLEMGLLFVNSAGQLTFHTRDWRMGYGAPDLELPPGTFDASMGYNLIDQFQINEQSVSTNIFTSGASAVNAASQNQYGQYATNGVTQGVYGPIADNSSNYNSPLVLPLICWNRAYTQLGMPSYTYSTDPYLDDYCAWEANSKPDPYLMPGQLTVDLLTLDPDSGIAISDLYALEIDNMVVPSGLLPGSFPNAAGATEWFIEGISETITQSSRQIQFYCSPAQSQRAWIPGDSTYGVLGQTTRIGISQSDLSTPQAAGKDVSHDAGAPYWAPSFSDTMNNPSGDGHAFVGADDIRGLTWNLQNALKPPMLVVGAQSETQALSTGPDATPQLGWDMLYADTANGMGAAPNWVNWYTCTVPGYYEIDATAVSTTTWAQGGNVWQAWIIVAEQAAQAVAANEGNPTNVDAYVCPIGEQQRINVSGFNVVANPSTRLYLGLGDMVALGVQQDSGAVLPTGTNWGGSKLSLRYVGMSTATDRAQLNSSLASGGTVHTPPAVSAGSTSFINLHTYTYYGATAHGSYTAYGLRNSDGNVVQGCAHGYTTGSQFAQVEFDVSNMRDALAGLTITGATLTCKNVSTWYSTGSTLMVGYFVDTPGGSKWVPGNNSNNIRDIVNAKFSKGSTRTFQIPVSIVEALLGNANGLMIGDDASFELDYSGQWDGGPSTWTLDVSWSQT